MSNAEIIEKNYNLLRACCWFQARKYDVPEQLLDDLFGELCLILMNYNNVKLDKITREKHLNAFVTGILVRMCYSNNSPFFRAFRKFSELSEEIKDYDFVDGNDAAIGYY